MQALIDIVWDRLSRIVHLEFQASPGAASGTHWQGHGTADVLTESAASTIRFFESGQFLPGTSSAPVSVHNVYLWQRQGQALLLSHERLGRESGVFLLRFTQAGQEPTSREHTSPDSVDPERADTGSGTLEGSEPHQCGQDQYRATLRLTEDGIRLDWAVTGPHKDERLVQQYGMGMRGAPSRDLTSALCIQDLPAGSLTLAGNPT